MICVRRFKDLTPHAKKLIAFEDAGSVKRLTLLRAHVLGSKADLPVMTASGGQKRSLTHS